MQTRSAVSPVEHLSSSCLCGCSERRCGHDDAQTETLSELKSRGPGGVHHVRVQLRSFQPRRLHQALKLYCSRCSSLQDVPDEEQVAQIFSAASRDSPPSSPPPSSPPPSSPPPSGPPPSSPPPCSPPPSSPPPSGPPPSSPPPSSPPPWLLSGEVLLLGGGATRKVKVHLCSELLSEGKTKELIFLQGSTLEEACCLADGYQNIVPVRSSGGGLALLDPTAPFLFRGGKRYYGCPRCSEASVKELSAEGDQLVDEKSLADALGVRLLQFVLLFRLELQDATDTLDVFLWKHAESFFNVSAESASVDQKSQDLIRQTMDALCPPGDSAAQRPWLDLCVAAYRAAGDGESSQLCYQICHTSTIRPDPV